MKKRWSLGLVAIFLFSVSAGAADVVFDIGESWYDETFPAFRIGRETVLPFDYGDPTPAEQAHLEAINRARMDPQAEADRLLEGQLNEGVPPEKTISITPKQPLTSNKYLLQAARSHSQDMIENDYFNHFSQDGASPSERINAAGYRYVATGENIAYSAATFPIDEVNTVVGFHDAFVIDENYNGRGHRVNIFNQNFKEVGIGVASGEYDSGENIYPYAYFITCDFAASSDYSESFVLGVVYDDQNLDGEYTAGEGIGNVIIEVVLQGGGTVFQTTTASAGGYAIPIPPGDYTIRAFLSDGKQAENTFSIVDVNVKNDFRKEEFSSVMSCGLQGDVNGDEEIMLSDAIIALEILSGISIPEAICSESDVNNDGKIGMEEVVYDLQVLANLRTPL